MSMSVITENPKIAIFLIAIGLPMFTGCLSNQSENMNTLPNGFAMKVIPLAIGSPFLSGLASAYNSNLKTAKANDSRQPYNRK